MLGTGGNIDGPFVYDEGKHPAILDEFPEEGHTSIIILIISDSEMDQMRLKISGRIQARLIIGITEGHQRLEYSCICSICIA